MVEKIKFFSLLKTGAQAGICQVLTFLGAK